MGENYFANPTGLISALLIFAALLAIPLSYVILRRYNAAVARSMQEGGEGAEDFRETSEGPTPPPLHIDLLDGGREETLSGDTSELFEHLCTARRFLLFIYILAGVIYALASALVLLHVRTV